MDENKRILIIGAGKAGTSLGEELSAQGENVVGYLDDHTSGETVIGEIAEVNEVISRENVTDVYIAIPSAENKLVRKIFNRISDPNVRILIVPHSVKVLKRQNAKVSDLQNLDIYSLLGRPPLKRDVEEQLKQFNGKTVLVTGAAGSIGSELTRQLSELTTGKIIALDWWENGIYNLQYDLQNKNNVIYKIGSIQSSEFVTGVLDEYKPDIIFHAAAYKHVPLMENNPLQAYINNVGGTYNLIDLAVKHKVKEFVYISTDKAVNPTNIMGSTKRIGEWIMKDFSSKQDHTQFRAVRFGNVLGSNGSVIPLFQKQIEQGGPLTLTDENVTRYFMTIPEAVNLVLSSTSLAGKGSIFVLDMGEQIKISDLAKTIIKFSGKDIEIKVIGLRPGEKMYEELSYNPKEMQKTANDHIFLSETEEMSVEPQIMPQVLEVLRSCQKFEMTERQLREFLKETLDFNITLI